LLLKAVVPIVGPKVEHLWLDGNRRCAATQLALIQIEDAILKKIKQINALVA
jgi:hypothetical protein